MNYKVLFSRKFMSSFNSFRENWMVFFEFLIFDRILQGFCELLRHFTGAFLALWCKLTAFKSCNCNLSIENQYGMTSDTVLTSNSFSYKWCSIFICSVFIWVLFEKYKYSLLETCKEFRFEEQWFGHMSKPTLFNL